ncbi:hypothetical protein ACHAWF_017751, partial [Thalassiosira exigua]
GGEGAGVDRTDADVPNGDEEGNEDYSRLLRQLFGRYARSGSADSDGSSDDDDDDDDDDDENEGERDGPGRDAGPPPQPARNHPYLPTAQPLYPEEWIPAGRRRHRSSKDACDVDASMRTDLDDGESDDGESGNETNRDGTSVKSKQTKPPAPSPPSPDEELEHELMQPESDLYAAATLPVMELEDVILFPGSTVPLRIRDRHWMTFLGRSIDDARGLYGPHRESSGGRGEVRLVLLPALVGIAGSSRGVARRTRRRIREGGGRTGRWRVDLIRRGATGARRRIGSRRSSGRRIARRSEGTEAEATEPSAGSGGEGGRAVRDAAPIDDDGRGGGDGGDRAAPVRDRDRPSERPSSPSSSSSDEGNCFYRPAAPPPVPPDPLVGRIGTVATITFTHEETSASADPDGPPAPGGGNGIPSSPRRSARRPSSAVWRDRGDELVVTLLGTARVRLLRSARDGRSSVAARGDERTGIPLYDVEEVRDGASSPPSWTMGPPGGVRCPLRTPASPPVNVEVGETMDESNGGSAEERDEVCTSYDIALRNLSLRSSTPSIAYRAMWPWKLCLKICNMIRENDEFRGLNAILPSAAGLDFADGTEGDDRTPAADADPGPAPAPFRVVDPSAFADWAASNMPLSQNDRLDLLGECLSILLRGVDDRKLIVTFRRTSFQEMICTAQQLRYILRKMEEKKEEAIIRCQHCGAVISQMRHVFSVGGSEGTTGAYVNEHGVVHQTMTLRNVDRHSVTCMGRPETRDSWFPGYSWTIAYCSICSEHLGWKFRKVGKIDEDDPDRPRSFWGFSSITTDNHVTPRRVSFHTRRALAALLQQG